MKVIFSFLVGIMLGATVFGQQTNSTREAELKANEKKAMGNDLVYERHKAIFTKKKAKDTDSFPLPIRNKEENLDVLTSEEKEKLRILRSPNQEDILRYRLFLQQKNTGIVKIFPDNNCETKFVITLNDKCLNLISQSWSYSFLNRDYGDNLFYDLRLKDKLTTDGFLSQNIIVGLGGIDINAVNLESEPAKFLLNFTPSTKYKEAKNQFQQIAKTVRVNEYTYGKITDVQENMTYLMRLIGYRLSDKTQLRILYGHIESTSEKPFVRLAYDKTRRDKIIVFQIIRKEIDGSITILWKELSSKKSPKLDFEKTETLTDFQDK